MTRPASGSLRSWWWLLAAATAAGVVGAVMLAPPPASEARHGAGHDVESNGFDLSNLRVPAEHLAASGMPRDGLHPVNAPDLLTVTEVAARNREGRGKLLVPSDRVVGVALGGEARAYPLRLLRWHEVVNDTVAGEPIAVTYSPLCDSVVVFRRTVAGRTLNFGFSGLLLNSNLLLYDRTQLPSLWSQLQGRAVSGPSSGQVLGVLPAALTTWQEWCRRHPHTLVMAPQPDHARRYRRDPYHSYFGSDLLRFPVHPLPSRAGLRLKDRVVAVTADGETVAFAVPWLARAAGTSAGSFRARVGHLPVLISFDRDAATAVVEPLGVPPTNLAVRHAFWFAWYAAYPSSRLHQVS